MKPLAIDLYCGLGGWTEGLLAEGYDVIGFDIVAYAGYPACLELCDVLSLHGSRFANAALIVGSSPCEEFSYRFMPWKRAKAMPPPVRGIELFNAQFRIQREASEAAGHHIPMVVENVIGAQAYVGRARWHHGSYYLWGDVPALMPMITAVAKRPGHDWNRYRQAGEVSPHWRLNGEDSAHTKSGGHYNVLGGNLRRREKRRAAAAQMAKIPLQLSRHIGRVYFPHAHLARTWHTAVC